MSWPLAPKVGTNHQLRSYCISFSKHRKESEEFSLPWADNLETLVSHLLGESAYRGLWVVKGRQPPQTKRSEMLCQFLHSFGGSLLNYEARRSDGVPLHIHRRVLRFDHLEKVFHLLPSPLPLWKVSTTCYSLRLLFDLVLSGMWTYMTTGPPFISFR